jgi:hypothetical protein
MLHDLTLDSIDTMLYFLHFSSINLSSQSGNSSRKEKGKTRGGGCDPFELE